MKKKVLILPYLFIMLMAFAILFIPIKTVRAEGNTCMIVETSVEYETVGAAWTAATSGQTIKLLADTNTGRNFSLNKNITFDFDNYTLTHDGSNAFMTFYDSNAYSLTLKASGNGGISTTKNLLCFNGNCEESARINIESGFYDKLNIYSYYGGTGNLKDDDFPTNSGLIGKINITGGKFFMSASEGRSNLLSFVSAESFTVSNTLPSGSNRYVLDVKPKTYITNNDTKASAKINYTEGYSYYQKVTTLSSSDAGKKYLIGYSNLSEKSILLLSGEKYGGWSYIIPDRHVYIPNLPTDTWRVESDSKFYGAVDNGYFYTLSYNAGTGKYRFTNSAGNYLTHTTGTSLTIKTPEEVALAASGNDPYRVDFTFTPSSSYLSTGSAGSTSYITYYTTQRDSKYVFEMYGEAQDSGLGEAKRHLYAHLYEKVDVDPVVNSASLRFGQTISKDMYDFLSGCGTTVTFGVIAKLTSALGGDELEYANAQIKKTITPVRVNSAGATEEDLEGDYYQFALVLSGLTSTDYETSVTARCFVCIDGHYYYFNPSVYSLKTLAAAYYNADDTSAYTDHLPVLGYLKDYGD